MAFPRSSGVLLHPTSLPGRYGIGDLGTSALEFIDALAGAGQRLWQVLPLGPTGYGDSPYQGLSAFAGNPLLISLDGLIADGLLTASEASGLERSLLETWTSSPSWRIAGRSGRESSIV
jgi:4-alpha-glucanotransferase